MNGAQAARTLRERGYKGLIVGMTGDPHGCEDRDAFEASGLDLCVDKAADGMETLAAIIAARVCRTPGAEPPEAASSESERVGDFLPLSPCTR